MDNKRTFWGWFWGILIAILIIGGIIWYQQANAPTTGTNATSTGSTMILPYGTVTLRLGEQGAFQGISITPLSVAEDSRCASGVQCVQAGTVRVVVRSDLDSGATLQNTVSLGSSTPVGTFTVALDSVLPQAQAGTTISDQDYRFTFEVHQSAGGTGTSTGLQGKG